MTNANLKKFTYILRIVKYFTFLLIIMLNLSVVNIKAVTNIRDKISVYPSNEKGIPTVQDSDYSFLATKTGVIFPSDFAILKKTLGTNDLIFVIRPKLPCTNSTDCMKFIGADSPMECEDGECECEDPLCLIYTYQTQGIVAHFAYSCGKCGQLGSECERDEESCDPPGICAADEFCHCPKGEHNGDLCVVIHGKVILQFLIGALIIFLFLTGMAVLYQTILSYRQNRTLCWCRNTNRRRRNRNRRQQQQRLDGLPVKTPAYTTQRRILENFHQSDDSSDDARDADDKKSIDSKNNDRSSTSEVFSLSPITKDESIRDPCSSTSGQGYTNEFPHHTTIEIPLALPPPYTEKASNPMPVDTSGMTNYFQERETQL